MKSTAKCRHKQPFSLSPGVIGGVLLVLAGSSAAWASDLAREARLSAEIVDTILDGEPVELVADRQPFLGIFTESESDSPRGGVLILHGRGFHPDWSDVVQPLRTELPARGWHTLSLQMPVLDKTATFYEYIPVFPEAAPRIEAGIDFLKARGIDRVVLIAHSCSVHMSMYWFDNNGDARIDGYVGLGMGATDYKQPMERPFSLAKMAVPVLDLYGEEEYPAVLRGAPGRALALRKAGHPKSRQQVLPGADHYFHDQGDALVDAVADWLDSL